MQLDAIKRRPFDGAERGAGGEPGQAARGFAAMELAADTLAGVGVEAVHRGKQPGASIPSASPTAANVGPLATQGGLAHPACDRRRSGSAHIAHRR